MSDEKISLEWLGTRVLTLTAEMRDLQRRFTALETRLSALESRFGGLESRISGIEARLGGIEARLAVIEERMTAMLGLVVRIAERLDGGAPPAPQ
jgi:predicted  nucleic acid-binding Zn-ribbon protein